jgi:DNA-binding response OmpR family regulator
MKILIVEDEKTLALEIAEFLGNEGYLIEHAWQKKTAEDFRQQL